MYDWVRALLDPTDIVQSPTSAKKQITPPPKFELPMDEPSSLRRSRRSVSPSKKSTSPRKSRSARSAKDVLGTPSTAAANSNLQEALEITASMEAAATENGIRPVILEEVEVKEVTVQGSPEKKKGRKSKKAAAETEEDKEEEEEEEPKDKKKTEKKEKKKAEKTEKKKKDAKEETEKDTPAAPEAADDKKTTTFTLDMPISLPEVPSAAETKEMIAKAKEMVEDAIKSQAEGSTAPSSSVTATNKRKAVEEEDDEETAAEAAQRAKKAKVLEDKLKRERVRNRALFGVSAAFALAYVLVT